MKHLNKLGKACQFVVLFCLLLVGTSTYSQEIEGEGTKDTKTKDESSTKEPATEKDDSGMTESSWYDEPEANEDDDKDTIPMPIQTFSLMIGGVPLENSLLLLAKGGYERGHFGAYLEVSRDELLNVRDDKSQDHYFRWNYSASGRFYSGKPGRDFFAEVAITYSFLSLWVTETNGETFVDRGNIPMTGLGVGYRLGRKPKGIFGEIGARGNMFLGSEHLYTDFLPASDSKDNYISDRSWFLEQGKYYVMFYASLGVAF